MKGYVAIDESLCKGCALCTGVCPKAVLRISTERYTTRGYRPVELDDPAALAEVIPERRRHLLAANVEALARGAALADAPPMPV